MALFARTRIEDPALRRLAGHRRILAAGRSPDGPVLGLADALLYVTAQGPQELGWHEIQTGGWDRDERRLHWTRVDGTIGGVELTQTGGLPDLFNERVTASIALVRTVTLERTGSAVISARRSLSGSAGALTWSVRPGRGTTEAQVAADPLVGAELERLRAEYDLS